MIGDIFGIGELICKLLILMVAGIFKLVSGAYQIFLVLAKTNIFEQDTYAHLTDKVYIILAVTMLFVVAYTFITLIIDPDKNKGGKAVEDLIKKSVTSLILIVLCPTLFTLAFDLQDAIMDQDIIGKFFTSETSGEEETKKSVKQGGNLMAGTTFAAFFYPTFESTTTYELKNQSEGKHLKKDEYEIDCSKAGSCTLQEAIDYASATGTFSVFTAFAKNWLDGEQQKTSVDFNMLLALIAGFYLLWVIISFCFDLAIRVIKLAFYQVIAPICIACRMLPDKDSIFKNWWKAVCKTYLSIFIRVFIMNLAVFLMVELTKSNFWSNICNSEEMECGGVIKFLAFAFLVLGLVTFIKQASKLIDEIFGLGDVKLGITDKLKEGGGFAAGAAIGAGVKGGIHGASSNFKGWKGMSTGKKIGTVMKTPFSIAGRSVGAMKNSLSASTNSFGFAALKKETEAMKANSGQAVQDADIQHLNNEDLKDKWFGKENGILRGGSPAVIAKLKREIESKKAERDALKKLHEETIELKARISKVSAAEAEIADLTRQQLELTKKRDAATDPDEKKKFDSQLTSITDALNQRKIDYDALKKERDDKITEVTKIQSDYNLHAEHKITSDLSTEAGINQLDEYIGQLEGTILQNQQKIEDSRYTQWKADIETKVKQYVTGIDESRAQEIVTKYNDSVKSKTTKIINKYASNITVSMEDAIKKQKDLSGYAAKISELYSSKSVQEVNAMASQLNIAQSYDQVRNILGEEVSNLIGLNEQNFIKMKGAFVNAIQEPYQKDINKAVSDAIANQNINAKFGGRNVFKDTAAGLKVLQDLDAVDVTRELYAYTVAAYEIFGPAGITNPETGKPYDYRVAGDRKAIEDLLRQNNAANDRAKSIQKVMGDVKSVTTKGDKSGK